MIHTIHPNWHYSNRSFPRIHFGVTEIAWKITLDESCRYEAEPGTAEYEQINKLPGITYGFRRHKNEFRFGWRSRNGKAEIFAYHYINGKKPSLPEFEKYYKICEIEFGKEYNFELDFRYSSIRFIIARETSQSYTRYPVKWVESKVKPKCGWVLGFYNGGKKTYSQTMKANIERVKI